jgi:hypothetical protein
MAFASSGFKCRPISPIACLLDIARRERSGTHADMLGLRQRRILRRSVVSGEGAQATPEGGPAGIPQHSLLVELACCSGLENVALFRVDAVRFGQRDYCGLTRIKEH